MTPQLRLATFEDLRFVKSSWFDSYWNCYAKKKIEGVIYREEMRAAIERTINPTVRVLVAFFPEVPDEVLGWSATEGDVLHYVYVKGVYRRRGIGRGLVPDGTLYYTHGTDASGRAFAQKLGLRFNPFRA